MAKDQENSNQQNTKGSHGINDCSTDTKIYSEQYNNYYRSECYDTKLTSRDTFSDVQYKSKVER